MKLYGPSEKANGRGSALDSSLNIHRPSAGTIPKINTKDDDFCENLSEDSEETGVHCPAVMDHVSGLISSKEVSEVAHSPPQPKS